MVTKPTRWESGESLLGGEDVLLGPEVKEWITRTSVLRLDERESSRRVFFGHRSDDRGASLTSGTLVWQGLNEGEGLR